MVLEIRLSNFFSIRDEVVLDLRAGNIQTKQAKELANNTFSYKKEKVLKTVALYGANASGKSNIIRAIKLCREVILHSDSYNEDTFFDFQPFKLDIAYRNRPSKFFIRFVIDKVEYEYSFSLTTSNIVSEELFYYPKGRIAKLFTRNEAKSDGKRGKYEFSTAISHPMDVARNTSDKTLFISRASQMDRPFAKDIFNYFRHTFLAEYDELSDLQIEFLYRNNEDTVKKALRLADSHIVDVRLNEFTKEKVALFKSLLLLKSKGYKNMDISDISLDIKTYHKSAPDIPFDFETEESAGTKKFFRTLLRIIDVVKNDKIIFIDEIDVHLHTDIVEFIVQLFHTNDKAQLIYSTHNTNLLDLKKLRKDQIYFVNKNEEGASELYSLYDFKDFRDSMDAEKGYLQGRFDAIPFIDDSEASLKALVNG